jgi:hypothetical protein
MNTTQKPLPLRTTLSRSDSLGRSNGWNPKPLPPFNEKGDLLPGVHDTTLEFLQGRLTWNEKRSRMWDELRMFLLWSESTKDFKYAYLGGGFVSTSPYPTDIDVILETNKPYSPAVVRTLEPFFKLGLETIRKNFSVHLHFWIEGFPGETDFRSFFQCTRPNPDSPQSRLESTKGIVRTKLDFPSILPV